MASFASLLTKILAGILDEFVPLEGWAGIDFVGLDVVVADDAVLGF